MMAKFQDDSTLARSKYPQLLCANSITMGGNGDQKQLNVAAFGNAYRRYAIETEAQTAERPKAEVAKLSSDYQALREQYDQSQRDLNSANNAIQGHLATINRLDRENTIYRLTAGEAEEPTQATA